MRNLSPQESSDPDDSGAEQIHTESIENQATPTTTPGVNWSRLK